MDRFKRFWHWFPSLLIMAGFLWLAFSGTSIREVLDEAGALSYWWVAPFLLTLFASHWVRAVRWNLILPSRISLHTSMAGVMTGYMTHYVIPRSGEVARPYYVASRTGQPGSRLLGTVLMERVVDMGSVLLLLLITLPMLESEQNEIGRLLGWETTLDSWQPIGLAAIGLLLLFAVGLWSLRRWKPAPSTRGEKVKVWLGGVAEGVMALRSVRNWPLFVGTTLAMWGGYLLMSFWPLYMLELPARFGLGLQEAWLLTLVATVGVAIPTPGGIGSYHLLIQQSLWIFYGVPLATGLVYATMTHAATAAAVFLVGALALWADKRWNVSNGL